MARIRQVIVFFAIFMSMFAFLATAGVVALFVRDRWRRVRVGHQILKFYTRWGLFLLNVKVNINRPVIEQGLFVGNHLSYLDILVIASRLPTSFVTSVEIKETPLLGQICQMAGCLFVERRNKFNLQNEIRELTEGLERGINVTVFPEATSTNGEQILRFRRPLFMSAILAKKPVIPFCLNYRMVGKEKISIANRDDVFWYGDMDFAPHLWRLVGAGEITVDIVYSNPLTSEGYEDPTDLAAQSQMAVEMIFSPVRPVPFTELPSN